MGLLSGAVRTDPVMGYNFLISLLDTSSALAFTATLLTSAVTDLLLGGFTECSGLEMSLDVEEYREGGRNGEVLKFPTRVQWGNVTMKKGVGVSTALWDWHYSFAEGRGSRRDGLVILQNDLHIPNNIWYFRRGLPVRYIGPAMNASQSHVAIESIEIAHEGIYQVPFVGVGAAIASGVAGAVT
jgi:phage tail-like protein